MMFSVYGLQTVFRGWKKGVQLRLTLLVLPILGFVVFHSFATSIPRYQYMAVPLFLLSAVCMDSHTGNYAVEAYEKPLPVQAKGNEG
jgi:hypothetical protein